jgi:hypothetical protein
VASRLLAPILQVPATTPSTRKVGRICRFPLPDDQGPVRRAEDAAPKPWRVGEQQAVEPGQIPRRRRHLRPRPRRLCEVVEESPCLVPKGDEVRAERVERPLDVHRSRGPNPRGDVLPSRRAERPQVVPHQRHPTSVRGAGRVAATRRPSAARRRQHRLGGDVSIGRRPPPEIPAVDVEDGRRPPQRPPRPPPRPGDLRIFGIVPVPPQPLRDRRHDLGMQDWPTSHQRGQMSL